MSYADLSEANLRDAKLDRANLQFAAFANARLDYAYLPYAQLCDATASLWFADLTGSIARDRSVALPILKAEDVMHFLEVRSSAGENSFMKLFSPVD